MKQLIIIFFIALVSCHGSSKTPVFNEDRDTIERILVDTSASKIPVLECEAEKRAIDSLRTELFLSRLRIEKVRYYLNICIRKPSQDKFLKGWIKRAIE